VGIELADTSAWTNRHKAKDVREDFDRRLANGRIATCDMVMLELLWTARDRPDFIAARSELEHLRLFSIGRRAWDRAFDVFEELTAAGPLHHRSVALSDLLIAATAELAEVPLCHYDRDFDLIAAVTSQPVRAIAPLGSL
jgi:predicted nucleic acid-binding protein